MHCSAADGCPSPISVGIGPDTHYHDLNDRPVRMTTGEPVEKHNAAELLKLISEGTHVCGDPGVQYHTTVNRWNTCSNSGEICASNPCSEYMFLNDSACNLASLNPIGRPFRLFLYQL